MLEWLNELTSGYCMRPNAAMEMDCGLLAVRHTFARMAIHLACSSGLVLLSLTAWHELAERGLLWKLRGYSLFAIPLLIALLAVFLREPLDVAAGDAAGKSYWDLFGWALGCALSVVGLWRLSPRIEIARKTIAQQREYMRRRRER